MAISITKNGVGAPLYAAGGNILLSLSPSIDQTYGPWPSLEEAFSCLTQIYGDTTKIPVGVTVGVISAELTGRPAKWVIADNAEIKEYQIKCKCPETGYTVTDLVEKQAASVDVDANTIATMITDAVNAENPSEGQLNLIAALDAYLTLKKVVVTTE